MPDSGRVSRIFHRDFCNELFLPLGPPFAGTHPAPILLPALDAARLSYGCEFRAFTAHALRRSLVLSGFAVLPAALRRQRRRAGVVDLCRLDAGRNRIACA